MAEIPVESLIREAATSRGVDPDLAVRIAQKESSLYPRAKNPRSSAYGLFQITNDTWKDYGGKPENRYDMMENIRIGMDIIASNRDTFLKKFGRAPNSGELYTMHMMGRTGGPKLMSQDPNALMADVVSPKVIKANKIPSTQTVGEFIASMQQKMGSKVDTMMAKRGTTEQKAGTVPTPKAPKETIKEKPVREPIIPLAEGEMRKRPLPDQRLSPIAQGEVSQEMIASLGPNYQAALGAMALGDTSEDDLDFDDDEALGDRYQRYVAEQDRIRLREMEDAQEESRPTALASLDLSYQSPFEQSPFEEEQPQAPVMLAHGGVVHRRDGSPPSGEKAYEGTVFPYADEGKARKALEEYTRLVENKESMQQFTPELLIRGETLRKQAMDPVSIRLARETAFESPRYQGDPYLPRAITAKDPVTLFAGLPGAQVVDMAPLKDTTLGGFVFDRGAMEDARREGKHLSDVIFMAPPKSRRVQEILEMTPGQVAADRQMTLAHEAEHLLAKKGLVDPNKPNTEGPHPINSTFDTLVDSRTARGTFVRNAAGIKDYLTKKYDVHLPAYFSRSRPEEFHEQIATLSAIEQVKNVDLTQDPELRKTLFKDPTTRKAYRAITGLRQTRLDARDLPPYTMQPEPGETTASQGALDFIRGQLESTKEGLITARDRFARMFKEGAPQQQQVRPLKKAQGGVVHRRDGSPIYGEMVPDSGPVTEDTRKALSTRQGLSAAEMMRMLKGVGSEGVSNLESIVRGQEAMLLGSPGDVESIFRSDEKRIFPTSDEVLKKFLPRVTSPTREAEGFEAVGMYVPPPIPSSAFSTGAELIKQGASKVGSTAKNLLPKKQVIPADLFPTRKLSSQELLKQLNEVDPAALERGKQAFLKDSAEKRRMYHGTRHSVGLPDIQVLEDGTIKQVYSDRHGFSEFKPRTADMTFLSPDPSFSETFAGMYKHASGEKYLPHGGTMYPVYAKVKKPFDYENLEHVKELADEVIRLGKKKSPNLANLYKTDPDFPFWATRKDYAIDALSDGSWATLESPIVIQAIKNLKYDGVYMKESGVKNLGVFDPKNIKSATGNIGTYDVKNPDIRKAHGGVVHRKDGSPIYGEVADSGPITEDTRIALSLPQGLSSAELMKLFKNVGKEGVSNLESLARGSVAAVPGLVGDIESIFRSDKERKFATTPEVERQYLPKRLTAPTKESAGFIEAGTFIDPTVGLKVAKPVAKGTAKAALAGFKSVSPQLENILEKSALGTGPMYVVKPTGGTTFPPEMVSKIDDYLQRIERGVTDNTGETRPRILEGNELKGKDTKKIIDFVKSKGRDYLTKRYGSPKDEMKEAILDGRVTLTGADAELFPPRLLAEAREGNPVALERYEEIYDRATGLRGIVVADDFNRATGSRGIALTEDLKPPKEAVAKQKEWEKLLKEGALPHEINLNIAGIPRKDLGYGYGSDAETELRKFLSGEKTPTKEASAVMYAARHGEPIYDLDSMYPRLEYLEPDTVIPALASVVNDLDRMSFPEALVRGMKKTEVLRNDEAAIAKAAQGKSVPVELFQRGVVPLTSLGDFSLVRVQSPFAVRLEGASMGHSIGNYATDASYGLGGKKAFESGETQVFSIRNAEGKPIVTMDAEIVNEGGYYGYPKIDQIRAVRNSEPNEQEKQIIFKALDSLYPNLDLSELEKFLPAVEYKNARDGRTLPLGDRTEIDWWQAYTNSRGK